MNKSRVQQIIKEELDRATGIREMAMTPAERNQRRRELKAARAEAEAEAYRSRMARFNPRELGDVPGSEGSLTPGGPLPGMMSYQRAKVAYIEPEFQAESGIYTVDDFKAAAKEGRAMLWSAGEIGSAQPSSYTIVPAGVSAMYNEATDEPGYPYAYTTAVKDPTGKRTSDVKTVVRTGAGSRGEAGPRPMADYVIERIEQFFTEIVPLPALTMKKKEAEAEAAEMSQSEDMPGETDPGMEMMSESIIRRWNKAAGLLK